MRVEYKGEDRKNGHYIGRWGNEKNLSSGRVLQKLPLGLQEGL